MNAQQLRSLGSLSKIIDIKERKQYGAAITNYELKTFADGTLWVSFQVELLGLPENNMLRIVDHSWWAFQIGKRGATTAVIYPKQFKQFKGGRFHGVSFQ